ncbi:copper chaperone for superoxide dismutase isoform X3 [Aquarana catesbeiana]|uniref:copper chaperone for superoxide dismutase isoform X3 n=1 Tax=Aquarana catesbeiana TaxID=8400 RepID=UPI003CCA4AB3
MKGQVQRLSAGEHNIMDPSGHTGVSCKLEFAVQITCGKCVDAVKSSLQNVQENLGAAVAMMSGEGSLQGVVRFLQVSEDTCVIDGTVDGLSPGLHGLHIHEFGDNSAGCKSCGGHYNPFGNNHGAPGEADSHVGDLGNILASGDGRAAFRIENERVKHVGDLGNILASGDGRAAFRIENERVKVWDVIGRSLLVDEAEDDLGRGNHPSSKITGNSGKGLVCGIIARSAGLFENTKKMCSCDGVTIWEERDHPVAGPGRKKKDTHAHL